MQHEEIEKGNIHIIHNLEFANITERDSYTPSTEDINKICLVLEPYGFFALRSIEPIDWRGLSSITIDLADFSVYSKDQTNELLNFKSDTYDIGATEYKCGYKRGGKEVFGIEVDFGTIPSNTSKTATIPNFDNMDKIWINTSESYTKSQVQNQTLAIQHLPASTTSWGIMLCIDHTAKQILVRTNGDYSTYTETKIILNYTKGA